MEHLWGGLPAAGAAQGERENFEKPVMSGTAMEMGSHTHLSQENVFEGG